MDDHLQNSNRSQPRSRAVLVISLVAVGVAAAAVGVLALRVEGEGPVAVVEAFEGALERGDHEAAHALVDYRFRLGEVLGAFFDEAPEVDRAELERLTRGMLVDTTEKLWPTCCRGRTMRRVVAEAGEDDTWVSSTPEGGDAFIWRYRLIRRQGAWRITQREYLKDQSPSNTTQFWPLARRAVARRLGRDPTLSEFNANLLSVMPTLRVRTFTVPANLAPPSPTAPAPTER